jgi:hypothetical protein
MTSTASCEQPSKCQQYVHVFEENFFVTGQLGKIMVRLTTVVLAGAQNIEEHECPPVRTQDIELKKTEHNCSFWVW